MAIIDNDDFVSEETDQPTVIPAALVSQCPRCGTDHGFQVFFRFKRPFIDQSGVKWEYWNLCPVTHEPVVSRAIQEENSHGTQETINQEEEQIE